jgi:hypothetical protein
MFGWIEYNFKLIWLRYKLDRLHRAFDVDEAKCKSVKEYEELRELHADEAMTLDDGIKRLVSVRLVRSLERDFLPMPEGVQWEDSAFSGQRHLTDESVQLVRGVLQQEHRFRAERWQIWALLHFRLR